LQYPKSQRTWYTSLLTPYRHLPNTSTPAFLELAIDHPQVVGKYNTFEKLETRHKELAWAYRKYAFEMLKFQEENRRSEFKVVKKNYKLREMMIKVAGKEWE
jgi:hypothetical protein